MRNPRLHEVSNLLRIYEAMSNTPTITADELLRQGLCVIETRSRDRDKNLQPWKLRAAFVMPEEAHYFLQQYEQTGAARVRKP